MTSKGSDSRRRILDTVTQLFLQKGYHGTGIQEISEATSLGRGALYYHIGSKEQILFEISMSLLKAAQEATLPFAHSDDTPDVRFRNVARALLRHHAAHGDGWLVAVQEARFLTAEHHAQVLKERQRFEDIWREILVDGAAEGYWRPVDAIDVRGILGMFNYVVRWVKLDGELTPEQIADRYVDMLLEGLAGSASRDRAGRRTGKTSRAAAQRRAPRTERAAADSPPRD